MQFNMADVKEKILSKGYWKIILRPTVFMEKRIPDLKSCIDIIRDNEVRLRGWYYPYYDRGSKPDIGDDFIEQSFCWEDYGHIEAWRYYQSGQFVHYRAVDEEWAIALLSRSQYYIPDTKFIDFIMTIYLFTEIFEFASRLGEKGYLGDSCEIIITLADAENRTLVSIDRRRHLMANYTAKVKEIKYSTSLLVSDLVANPDDHALDAIKYVFERFGWLDFDKEVFKPIQKKLRDKEWD